MIALRPLALAALAASLPLSAITSLAQQRATPLDSTTLASFRWRSLGPADMGGRIADIVGIPSPSKTFYVAAVAGGIWKTTNAGTTFRPLFGDQRVISMGALAIAPSDTNQVWAGTGEQNTRNSISPGGGIYKSTDGGMTWRLMGLEKTQQIGRIVVH
ncbi:MAG: glycosyl hydrolase, partial [Gemmatimonadota bacterium]|nr:glycosyl hydrolase [Gemmatimonadota bacterium]